MHRIGAALLGVIMILYSLTGGARWIGETMAEAADSSAPAFELVTFAGDVYSNDSLKGRPVLLVFWAPWCKVCQRELPMLGQFYRQGETERPRVLSIGFCDSRGPGEQ